ncbi:MAG: hypothetical protein KIT60_04570 [Burkholderiaceae bacterium]|nr:hypothetical protein [Burkholderiaceae bacterium]
MADTDQHLTPSVIVAQTTTTGAPESIQGAVAGECGFEGRHWQLTTAVERAEQAAHGQLLPLGATGADMGPGPSLWARGLALIGRNTELAGRNNPIPQHAPAIAAGKA